VDAGPVPLYVEEHGSGEPLVLVTGLGYAVWCWERQLPAFAARRRVVTLDNRGAGRSPKPPGPYSIEGMADDVAAVLDRLGIESAPVLGHSMGGYIAQELALRHPSRARSLVLVGTGPGGPRNLPVPEETLSQWLANAYLPPAEYARATMFLSFAPGWTDEHPFEYDHYLTARLEHPTPPEAWRAQFEAANAWIRAARPIEQISVPTLVVHGDADRVVPVENGRELARRIPGAELRELPGRGHVLILEEPDEFNRLVLDFLS
jgi:pimeloyl-ACP methyl ester carboxylesterase